VRVPGAPGTGKWRSEGNGAVLDDWPVTDLRM
jgi:hypothetical protein